MKIWNEIWDYVKMIIIVVVVVLVINNVVLINAKIPSESMENTIMTGDRIFGYRLAYGLNMDVFGHEISKKWKDPERFDIIIFPYQWEPNTYYIKRIIGLPGETIQIDDEGNIYIDGEMLRENYGLERIQNPGLAREPVTLGEDEYFVLGDNRNNSTDSRFAEVGVIHRDDIVGRAWVRIYPFDSIGVIRHQ